jgi:cystathionine beta-lyase/cystathionine gamma-synthase
MTKTPRPRPLGLSTLAIHGDREGNEPDAPISTPLFQSVNYVQHFGTDEGLRYARYGNTPNAEAVQKRLALVEGSEAACIMASGMAATACGLLALLRPGDHLLASSWLYGGTMRLLMEEFIAFGISVTFVDPMEPRSWRKRLRKETRAIFLESPVNPTCRVLDIRPVAYLAHEEGLALVVDSTFASPVNFRPLQHGADVVIHSATKYLNGHHDVLAGVVCGTAPYIDEVRQKMILWGQPADPFACWLLERGLKTLDVRVRRQNETALRVADWCAKRKEVKRVHYPGLKDHPDHKIATELLEGFGGMLAIELAGGGKAADKFVRKLRLIQYAASLGGVDTILSEPRYSSHAKMTPEQRTKVGIPDGFMRLSIGLEDADDIIADIEQAL